MPKALGDLERKFKISILILELLGSRTRDSNPGILIGARLGMQGES